MLSVAVPGFCTETSCAALEVPTFCFVKFSTSDENEMIGVGRTTVNFFAFESPPPGAGLLTVIDALPLLARSAAGTLLVSTVAAEKVVGKGVPFQFTVEDSVNPLPFTVS
jgi:hypothetical protein